MSRFARTLVGVVLSLVLTPAAFAKSPVTLGHFEAAIDFSVDGPVTPFVLSGTASHLGKFTAYGEAEFRPGQTEGSLVGDGVAVFEAANGDTLVGVATWHIDPDNTLTVEFPWRDSVQFSDGTIVPSTGRFLSRRPPGLSVFGPWGSCTLERDGLKIPAFFDPVTRCCCYQGDCEVQPLRFFSRR